MQPDFKQHNSNSQYFDRTPEKLVLEGYRHWLAGYVTGSIRPWEAAHDLYAQELGAVEGRRVLGEMSNLVRTVKRCATCPPRHFPRGSHHICTDECMIMGLVSGIQNDDGNAIEIAVNHLACGQLRSEVYESATSISSALIEVQQTMLPIPADILLNILAQQTRPSIH